MRGPTRVTGQGPGLSGMLVPELDARGSMHAIGIDVPP